MKYLLLITALLVSNASLSQQHGNHGSHKEKINHESHTKAKKHKAHGTHKKHHGDTIAIHHPTIKTTPPGITNSAAYFTIINNGKKDVTLTSVASDGAKLVEMHEHIKHNGTFKMQKMKPLKIPANGKANFEPGGNHIMLIGVTKPIENGDKIDITLSFDDGTQKTITTVAKKQYSATKKAHHKHH